MTAAEAHLPFAPYSGRVWRLIEGQYRPATNKIVDILREQQVLEEALEATKPPIPPECAHLDYRLSAPFRYGIYPGNSRFRRPGRSPGVYYAAERSLTAALETAWWSAVRFFRASPDTKLPDQALDRSAIEAAVAAPIALDLMEPAMAGAGPWMDPTSYEACQQLADRARHSGCEAIRYASVRDPDERANLALLSCRAFERSAPVGEESWHIFLKPDRVQLFNETGRAQYEYRVGETAFAYAG
ncbi:MAG: RES family NAD+ phosphorylase [Pseudomonadota bacterium]